MLQPQVTAFPDRTPMNPDHPEVMSGISGRTTDERESRRRNPKGVTVIRIISARCSSPAMSRASGEQL